MSVVSLVLRDSTRKIVPFIVKIQLQFEMRHQFGVTSDRKEMMHIRNIPFCLECEPAGVQATFVMIGDKKFHMVRCSPKDMWTDCPKRCIKHGKRIVVDTLAYSPLEAKFPMVGETLLESDVPDM